MPLASRCSRVSCSINILNVYYIKRMEKTKNGDNAISQRNRLKALPSTKKGVASEHRSCPLQLPGTDAPCSSPHIGIRSSERGHRIVTTRETGPGASKQGQTTKGSLDKCLQTKRECRPEVDCRLTATVAVQGMLEQLCRDCRVLRTNRRKGAAAAEDAEHRVWVAHCFPQILFRQQVSV